MVTRDRQGRTRSEDREHLAALLEQRAEAGSTKPKRPPNADGSANRDAPISNHDFHRTGKDESKHRDGESALAGDKRPGGSDSASSESDDYSSGSTSVESSEQWGSPSADHGPAAAKKDGDGRTRSEHREHLAALQAERAQGGGSGTETPSNMRDVGDSGSGDGVVDDHGSDGDPGRPDRTTTESSEDTKPQPGTSTSKDQAAEPTSDESSTTEPADSASDRAGASDDDRVGVAKGDIQSPSNESLQDPHDSGHDREAQSSNEAGTRIETSQELQDSAADATGSDRPAVTEVGNRQHETVQEPTRVDSQGSYANPSSSEHDHADSSTLPQNREQPDPIDADSGQAPGSNHSIESPTLGDDPHDQGDRESDSVQLSQKEQELREKEVQSVKPLAPGDHANAAFKVDFDDGTGGLYKPSTGETPGLRIDVPVGQFWSREIGASRLDELLGFDLVPTTTDWNGHKGIGSMQEWDTDADRGLSVDWYVQEDQDKMAVLDYVTGNTDRHKDNYLTDIDQHPVAIDNGCTFPEGWFDPIRSDFVAERIDMPIHGDVLDKVRSLDTETFADTLRSAGIGGLAIDGAMRRLQEIQADGKISGSSWPGKIVDANWQTVR